MRVFLRVYRVSLTDDDGASSPRHVTIFPRPLWCCPLLPYAFDQQPVRKTPTGLPPLEGSSSFQSALLFLLLPLALLASSNDASSASIVAASADACADIATCQQHAHPISTHANLAEQVDTHVASPGSSAQSSASPVRHTCSTIDQMKKRMRATMKPFHKLPAERSPDAPGSSDASDSLPSLNCEESGQVL